MQDAYAIQLRNHPSISTPTTSTLLHPLAKKPLYNAVVYPLTTESLVHYDDRIDPDFPRHAPPVRVLYKIPTVQTIGENYDQAFRIGLRRPTYSVSQKYYSLY